LEDSSDARLGGAKSTVEVAAVPILPELLRDASFSIVVVKYHSHGFSWGIPGFCLILDKPISVFMIVIVY